MLNLAAINSKKSLCIIYVIFFFVSEFHSLSVWVYTKIIMVYRVSQKDVYILQITANQVFIIICFIFNM